MTAPEAPAERGQRVSAETFAIICGRAERDEAAGEATTMQMIALDARARIAELERERDLSRALINRLILEAQIHSSEARAHKGAVHEAYQAVTEGRGEPGNWNGARPIVDALRALRAERDRLAAENAGLRAAGREDGLREAAEIFRASLAAPVGEGPNARLDAGLDQRQVDEIG